MRIAAAGVGAFPLLGTLLVGGCSGMDAEVSGDAEKREGPSLQSPDEFENSLPPNEEDLHDHTGFAKEDDPEVIAKAYEELAKVEEARARFAETGPDVDTLIPKSLHNYTINVSTSRIRDIAIAQYPEDSGDTWTPVHTYMDDNEVYEGVSTNLTQTGPFDYILPKKFDSNVRYTPDEIAAVAADWFIHFVWYTDGYVSAGIMTSLGHERAPYKYAKPSGFEYSHLQAVGIASTSRCYYYWLKGGKLYRSIGDSKNPTRYSGTTEIDNRSSTIRGIAIAQTTDTVYTWWNDKILGKGVSDDLW